MERLCSEFVYFWVWSSCWFFFPQFLVFKCYEFKEESVVLQSGISLVLLQSASALPWEQTACSTEISSSVECWALLSVIFTVLREFRKDLKTQCVWALLTNDDLIISLWKTPIIFQKLCFSLEKTLRTKCCLALWNTKRRMWGDGILQEKNTVITESSGSFSSKIHTGIKSIITSKIV